MNKVLENIRIISNNVLVFSKSFPLVEDHNFQPGGEKQNTDTLFFGAGLSLGAMSRRNTITSNSFVPQDPTLLVDIGPTTWYPTDFRRKMFKEARESNQQLNLKFDLLNRDLIQYISTNGCKIWHISSQVFERERLCIESPNGLVEYLTRDQLREMLSNESKTLNVDLVVLALPLSDDILAPLFVKLGVKNVVAFNYDIYVQHPTLIGKVQEMIFKFCLAFYTSILSGKFNLQEAFDESTMPIVEQDREYIHILYSMYEALAGRYLFNNFYFSRQRSTRQLYLQLGPSPSAI